MSFEYFVVLAGMRTGSNFFEENLKSFSDLTCLGEVFNPAFVGEPGCDELLGVTRQDRDEDPEGLIEKIRDHDGISGFRLFDDHDFRVLDYCLNDPTCAKIVLLRNPLESYISLKIARKTGQWRLTNTQDRKRKTVTFKEAEFYTYLENRQIFQVQILNTLQKSGQTAFYIAYEDLQDVSVLNGVAAFLGCDERIDHLNQRLKRQNPGPIEQKVENPTQMKNSLAHIDWFNAQRTPHFEPRRSPKVTSYIAGQTLLYMPLHSGPRQEVASWMAYIEGISSDELETGFDRERLDQWLRDHPMHRSFTMVRHPLTWSHTAFCRKILGIGSDRFEWIASLLQKDYGLELPEQLPAQFESPPVDDNYDLDLHKKNFNVFLKFLRENMSHKTSVRMDPAWGSQFGLLQGVNQVIAPDLVMREDRFSQDSRIILDLMDSPVSGDTTMPSDRSLDPLSSLLDHCYDTSLEDKVREIYALDYLKIGFKNYK